MASHLTSELVVWLQEPPLRLRYESPINASPSRYMDHPRPFDYEEPELDRQSTHRSSLGRSVGTLPSYNGIASHVKRFALFCSGRS